MTLARGNQPPEGVGDPVSSATHLLAAAVHDDIVAELMGVGDAAPGSVERLESFRKLYPNVLFGELAMHLAGVTLPKDASAPDRARGIVEALRRIATTPVLFEAVTNAPFTQELATGIAPKVREAVERNPQDLELVNALRRKIVERGYLSHDMLPPKRLLQLEYGTSPALQPRRRFGRSSVPEDATVTLKLMPYEDKARYWKVKQYRYWNKFSGYRDYTGTNKVYLNEAFNIVSVESSAPLPRSATGLEGEVATIGHVSMGTPFKIEYGHHRVTEEVPGYEPDILNETLTLPMTLRQAYLGGNRDFPLFEV